MTTSHRIGFGRIGRAIGYCALAASALTHASDDPIVTKFVELRNVDGNAMLIIYATNTTAATITVSNFGCWTEDRSKIEGGDVNGSRFVAFNTGAVPWAGDIEAGKTVRMEGIVNGMPGDMTPMFKDQHFVCSAS